MKKTAIISLVILLFCAVSVSALEYGVNFNAGIKQSVVNTFLYQDVTFRLEFNDKCGADIGLEMMENFQCSPYFYLAPMLSFYAGHAYLAGGIFVVPGFFDEVPFFAELGGTIGKWQIGPGIGSLDIGLNISTTVYTSNTGDGLGDALASIFGTLFNIPKLKIGFEWYLPL